jgi:PUA domain protein
MCPGMTSPGAKLPAENIPKDTVVAIYAEGKEHALAVGLTNMSTVTHTLVIHFCH